MKCVRCGDCCKAEPCDLAREATGQESGRCQALIANADSTYSCLAYESADEDIKPFIRFKWGIGAGICTNGYKNSSEE
jgi:hypothetical protein